MEGAVRVKELRQHCAWSVGGRGRGRCSDRRMRDEGGRTGREVVPDNGSGASEIT